MYNAPKANNISSDTSDPSTAHMRVFVGNINTSAIDKQKLQEIFRKYGFVTGISIHRGYAFVQYNSQAAARKAAQNENGSTITDQRADVNIAAEPKPNQKPFSSGNMPGSFDGVFNDHCSTPSPIPMHPHQIQQPVVRGIRPQVGGVSSSTSSSSRGGKTHHGNHHGGGHHHHYHQQQQQQHSNNKNFHHHHHHHHPNHAKSSNNKVYNGRIVKNTNSNAHKSSFSKSNAAKTLVSSVVNLSAVRKELVEIRDKINSLLTVITKSGGIGIDQSQITFEMDQQAQQQQYNHTNDQCHSAFRNDSPMMTMMPSSGGESEPSPQRRHAAVGTTDCEIATTTSSQVVKRDEDEERESTPTTQEEEQQEEMVEEFTAKEEDDMSTVEEVVGIDSN